MSTTQQWTTGIDLSKASPARMYDYFLGGNHNFDIDRAAAQQVLAANPLTPAMCRANRAALGRMVGYLVDQGIRQFLDIGSGIPTSGAVHEIAQALNPDTRVLYVDIEQVAILHSMQLLADNDLADAVVGDLADPDSLLAQITGTDLAAIVDLDQPVGVLLMSVAHFLPDDTAYPAVARLRDALPTGSYLALTHVTADTVDATTADTVVSVYRQQATRSLTPRSKDEVAQFFDDLTMIDPGLVWTPDWRPDPAYPDDFTAEPHRSAGYAGLARKD
ncbi:SAM-dependent methyltransferase [Polymorphospora rubra]|uniref:S-adenosyl methyltransferase n=1 Tax=Polymorphospora rubra TaxID=338584 RepID=A0A810MU67_9ACTN|nr:SAM-dependent methyltransferase [Polymorphospora rubra]BCJ62985.1 hypothetical protein Prubr_00060 [Polymorphospora rubra]